MQKDIPHHRGHLSRGEGASYGTKGNPPRNHGQVCVGIHEDLEHPVGMDHASFGTLECGGCTWVWQSRQVTPERALGPLLDPLQAKVDKLVGAVQP